MPAIRFRSRHLHATFYDHTIAALTNLGWMSAPVNFGTHAVKVVDFQPDERQLPIAGNTVAVSLGDYTLDDEEELGALLGGGLRSALYSVYIDSYMLEQSLSLAICDDLREIYDGKSLDLINQITETVVPNCYIQVEQVIGPEKPPSNLGAETFKRYWRIIRVDARLYYQT